jgi:hypothetical protein
MRQPASSKHTGVAGPVWTWTGHMALAICCGRPCHSARDPRTVGRQCVPSTRAYVASTAAACSLCAAEGFRRATMTPWPRRQGTGLLISKRGRRRTRACALPISRDEGTFVPKSHCALGHGTARCSRRAHWPTGLLHGQQTQVIGFEAIYRPVHIDRKWIVQYPAPYHNRTIYLMRVWHRSASVHPPVMLWAYASRQRTRASLSCAA